MNQKKELRKIAKQAFPSSLYSLFECRNYRKNLYNEMSAYWHNHPENSPEDIRDLFCGDGMDDESTDTGISPKTKAFFIILGLLILICVTLFFFSSSWDATTITTN